uniref:Uncharacterized protein n=1 Tax=Octopus bimaculoides TaxID=37653 RepID=A0A0L8GLX1_OCTBM
MLLFWNSHWNEIQTWFCKVLTIFSKQKYTIVKAITLVDRHITSYTTHLS